MAKDVRRNLSKKFFGFALISFFSSALVALCLAFPIGGLQELESRTWDWRLQFTANPAEADSKIKLIVVDQRSLDFFESEYGVTWPVPRDVYQYVIQFLKRSGARGLAFDMLFTESSQQTVEEDRNFAEASSGPFPVINAVALETIEKRANAEKLELLRVRQQEADKKFNFSSRLLSGYTVPRFPAATMPIKELLEKSVGLANVQAEPDSDGVFRHYRPGGFISGVPILSLPFALYDQVLEGKGDINFNDFLDSKGRLALHPHGPSGTYQILSMSSVMQSEAALQEGGKPEISPDVFKDAWVFLGVWAPGLLDLRPTSLERRGKGVELLATVLDNTLHKNFAIKTSFLSSLLFGVISIVSVSFVSLFASTVRIQKIFLLLLIALFFHATTVLAEMGYWIPVIEPFIGMITAIVFSYSYQYQLEGRQHRFIKGAFQHYVSPGVIEQIVEDPSSLSLGGERRELTMFFSDISGFTSISESLLPTKLLALLNDYLTAMTDTILATGGTVDKYVGDAVVAFWNAPVSLADHARRGVQAAIDCQLKLAKMQDGFKKQFGVEVRTRIGLHTGAVSVGNFGSKSRFNYTVIGDAANLASRLEGVNKAFGTYLLISESTKQALGDFVQVRKVADLRVVGKLEVVTVYEPFYNQGGIFSKEHLEQYHHALKIFEEGKLEYAAELFAAMDGDPVAKSYLKRIEKDLAASNQKDWSAVWNMTEK